MLKFLFGFVLVVVFIWVLFGEYIMNFIRNLWEGFND